MAENPDPVSPTPPPLEMRRDEGIADLFIFTLGLLLVFAIGCAALKAIF